MPGCGGAVGGAWASRRMPKVPLTPFSPARLLQEVLVLETATAVAATQEILLLHSIPNVVSKDLLDVVPPGWPGLAGGEQQQDAATSAAEAAAAPEAAVAE